MKEEGGGGAPRFCGSPRNHQNMYPQPGGFRKSAERPRHPIGTNA